MNFIGEHEGSTYEVRLPEEVDPDQSQTSPRPDPNQKTVLDQDQKMVWVGSGNLIENKGTSESPKTSFKTIKEKNDDDETYVSLVRALKTATQEITGHPSSPTDKERWAELGEILITELKIAAARTTVSSVPAFLSEHLRRRLWKKDKQQLNEEGKSAAKVVKQPAVSVDVSKCPDCGGSGMYYPQGYEKGVAKCKHEHLREGK
jgi:hypothetical protein